MNLNLLSVPFRPIYHLLTHLRYFVLSAFFRLLISNLIWSEQSRNRYSSVLLDDNIPSTTEKEKKLLQFSSYLLHPFLRIYFRIARYKDCPYHIHIPQFVVLKLHKFTGLLDPSLEHNFDDYIYDFYDPLRHYIASNETRKNSYDKPGYTISMFQFANHFSTVADITQHIFPGFTRSFAISSSSDFSQLYYDVLQQNPRAVASAEDVWNIQTGRINAIAISYRHNKDNQQKLGITKHELFSAIRALHNKALLSGPSEQYCIWWDSVLKCSPERLTGTTVNWVAIGLASYAFCHVLSIRREEENEQRFWIDMERALASLGKGMTVVKVCNEQSTVFGYIAAKNYDVEGALAEGFKYSASGDLHESSVTFARDKKMLYAASLKLLCTPGGLGVVRGLLGDHDRTISEVESLKDLEIRLRDVALTVQLGYRQTVEGEGEAYLDESIELMWRTGICDRRNWLPNSIIYDLIAWRNDLPTHVIEQVVMLVERVDIDGSQHNFGLQLYHQKETEFCVEIVQGCLTDGYKSESGRWRVTGVSRLHIPTNSELLESFKKLIKCIRENVGKEILITRLEDAPNALVWLWNERELHGVFRDAVLKCLPNETNQPQLRTYSY